MEGTYPAARLLNRTNRRLITIAVALIAAVCLWYIAAYSVPFHPYTVHMYSVVPPQGCPNTPVEVRVDSSIRHPPFGFAGDYVLESSWVNVSSGQAIILPPYPGTFADNPSSRNTSISPVLRIAPNLPGRWRLYSTITVEGRVLGLRREAIIPYKSNDIFESLPADDGSCIN